MPDGYLWLLAHGGLVRFDGFQFKVFNRTNTPALKSTNSAAFGLIVDHEGALWAATWQGKAIRYFHGSFTAYTTRDGLPNNRVVRIDEHSATRHLIAAFPEAQVVTVTNYDDRVLRRTAQQAGACGYVLKENLLELRGLLQGKR